jgi:phospholipid-binding lipoprotein MlaA
MKSLMLANNWSLQNGLSSNLLLKSRTYVLALGVLLGLLQGCASGPNAIPADPLEPVNRTVFQFNDGLDRVIFKPVATAYKNVTPAPVRTGVGNFFGNLLDVRTLINNVLQAKPQDAAETFIRLGVNTVFGMGGVLDVASEMHLERQPQDFGQTLGVWGVGSGPYLVLPLLGSSSVRDAVGTVVEGSTDVVSNLSDVPTRNTLTALRVIDFRASFLQASELLDLASLDRYTFARDAYLQRKRAGVAGRSTASAPEERFDLPEPGQKPPPAGTPAQANPTNPATQPK